MVPLSGGAVAQLAGLISTIAWYLRKMPEKAEFLQMPVEDVEGIIRRIDELEGSFDHSQMLLTVSSLRNINRILKMHDIVSDVKTTMTMAHFHNIQCQELEIHCSSLLDRMVQELDDRLSFITTKEEENILIQCEAFLDSVKENFPDTIDDLMEAHFCLAVNRNTASVFHLMRAMESALRRIAVLQSIEVGKKPWGPILSEVDRNISNMPKGDERNQWSQIHAHLYHVKEAWRNDTMHPTSSYSYSQALDILRAVKTFLSALNRLIR